MGMDKPGATPEQDAAEDQGESSDPVAMYQELSQGMSQFAQAVSQMPDAPEDIQAAVATALDAWAKVGEIAQGMGGPMPADQGAVPMTGGMKGVPGGPQVKM